MSSNYAVTSHPLIMSPSEKCLPGGQVEAGPQLSLGLIQIRALSTSSHAVFSYELLLFPVAMFFQTFLQSKF